MDVILRPIALLFMTHHAEAILQEDNVTSHMPFNLWIASLLLIHFLGHQEKEVSTTWNIDGIWNEYQILCSLGKECNGDLRNVEACVRLGYIIAKQALEWHRRFRESREIVENHKHFGRPQTSCSSENIEKVSVAIRKSRMQTKAQIAESVGISSATCQRKLTRHLNMHRVCQHIVSCMLNEDEKAIGMEIGGGDLVSPVDKDVTDMHGTLSLILLGVFGDCKFAYISNQLLKEETGICKLVKVFK
ncbi:uncharacterized protein TNCV_911761 [Trichonephila clavipes]|nr:uncharacterized protein TNCV_911761 [Trichonephila clavipes]